MSTDTKGYVYILTNPSFREDWVKIGKTRRPVNVRSAELDNTAVPLPFNVYATLKTEQYAAVEQLVHRMFDRLTTLRIRQNREFFNIRPAEALAILRDIASVIPDAEIEIPAEKRVDVSASEDEEEAVEEGETGETKGLRLSPRAPFQFSMVGIQAGEELTFIPTGVKVTVAGENRIEYQGRLYTLSGFTADFIPKKNASQSYQGPKYFTYKDECLTDMRNRMEK